MKEPQRVDIEVLGWIGSRTGGDNVSLRVGQMSLRVGGMLSGAQTQCLQRWVTG